MPPTLSTFMIPAIAPISLLLYSQTSLADSGFFSGIIDHNTRDTLLIIFAALFVLQTLIMLGLQRSRSNHKRSKKNLKRSQRELEQRIIDRTNKLRAINNQLYDEIAKHEITEELLRETQDYLHSIINSMPSVLVGVTPQGYATHWNAAAELATGINTRDALGRHINQLYPKLPITSESISAAIEQGLPQINENIKYGRGSDAQYSDLAIYPLMSSEVAGAVIRIDDVTMRVRIENMMIQNEKMMSLGELAAGMAHEINNPLSAILHGVQNILRRTTPGLAKNDEIAKKLNLNLPDIHSYLEQREIFKFINDIRDAGERSAKIVTNMLEFSRSNSRDHQQIDITNLIQHSLDLAENTFELKFPDGIERPIIVKEFADNLPLIPGSAAELQQVILNLLRNANQSFSSEDYGAPLHPTITIRLQSEDNNLLLEVEDNGPGMLDTVRRHIFEPFFTTKEVGQGTGLGLSVSYFIITEHHDGTIEVDSTPGKGTLFSIRLPLSHNCDA